MTEPNDPELFTPNSVLSGRNEPRLKSPVFKVVGSILLITAICLLFVSYKITTLNQPTDQFPVGQPVTISEGMTVKSISESLMRESVVQSSSLLYYAIILFHDPTSIKASTYIFSEPLSTVAVAKRLTEGDFDTDLIRFTHYEGERVSQIAAHAALILPNFNATRFVETAEQYEGRLFPDTYLLPVTYTEEDLLNLLRATFEERITPLISQASSTQLTATEVVTLASIIEREANTPESMRLVSSVLQNRLEIGMALQADASIEYILDKPLSELTPEDLDIDSPYNTYLHLGLPPTPIGNPGLDAIMAVLEPTESDFFYYITDEAGEFHFAKTYSEHLRNIETYLR